MIEIRDFIMSDHKNDKQIVLFGDGVYREIVYRCLKAEGFKNIVISDRDCKELFSNVLASLVQPYSTERLAVILTANIWQMNDYIECLENQSFKIAYTFHNILDLCENYRYLDDDRSRLYNYYERTTNRYIPEMSFFNPQNNYITSLDAVVTERCSLRCDGCSNLMQYYRNPHNTNIEELMDSIELIISKVDAVGDLRILGGEPFMNCEFIKILRHFENENKVLSLTIWTNATIFPNEEVLDAIRSSRVILMFSDYGELSRNLNKWVIWCEKNKKQFLVTAFDKWQNCGDLERRDYSKYELREIYSTCECRNIPVIMNNKLYGCPRIANAANLGAMMEEEREKDELLLKDDISGDDITSFLFEKEYFEGCRYCLGRKYSYSLKPHVQLSQPLNYNRPEKETLRFGQSKVETHNSELISIVIPVYNGATSIKRCLNSVKRQNYAFFEVLIVDDGSTDNTCAICEEYSNEDKRFRLIRKEHTGTADTRRKGIEEAEGKYLCFVDADDYIEVSLLEELISEIEDFDGVTGGYIAERKDTITKDWLMDKGQRTHVYVHTVLKQGSYIGNDYDTFLREIFSHENGFWSVPTWIWGGLFRTDIMKSILPFMDTSVWYAEDLLMTHLYFLESKSVKVMDIVGYHWCRSWRNYDEYSKEGIFSNIEKIHSCILAFLDSHSLRKNLEYYVNKEFAYLMTIFLGNFEKRHNLWCGPFVAYPYSGLLKNKKVVLYGAGNIGKSWYRHILNENTCQLVMWVDKNYKEYQGRNMNVNSVQDLLEAEYDYLVVAVAGEQLFKEIKKELISLGIKEKIILWHPGMLYCDIS